ncbi:MAG TPA: T9SS type A sorting domain-containing protein, partial [Chitinophagaceae bacterium]|nr:T9SS type A sorting domain-containing protein [Chitinophagaceae bacterium]
MCYQNLQLAYAAGSYVNMQDVSDIAVTKSNDAFTFKLTRIGLGNEPVTVSMVPLENIQTAGAPVTISSLPNYYDTYTGSISYALPSSISNGQRIRFIWKVETGGYSYSDTVTKFYNPELLFTDDMEGSSVSTNWTVSSGWNYATDDKYSGAKSLTESPGAKYGTSAAQIATYNKTFNLTNATAVYLSFWVKHRAENFRDKLQVQVSTNGTTWVAVAGSTTVQEPGVLDGSTINGQPSLTGIREEWTPELFDLTSYKGIANLQLRFVFSSDGDGGSFTYEKDEGFFIDDLEVVKSSSPLMVLPVRFIDFYGKVLSDKSVQLTWEAITDEQHDYFEVERSADGIHFNTIGKVLNNVPYQYVDKAPISGINFYRIKQIDKNRNSLYSKIVKLNVQSRATVTTYPNPVTNTIKVKWTGAINEAITLQVTDLQGRIVYKQDCKVDSGSECTIDANHWKPQVYILKLLNKQKEELGTQKITKL